MEVKLPDCVRHAKMYIPTSLGVHYTSLAAYRARIYYLLFPQQVL